jgi:serine/threonine-protein kinase
MALSTDDTASGRPPIDAPPSGLTVVCPSCAKVLEGEPNFCPACGGDLRGLSGSSDTFSGGLKDQLIDNRYRLLEKLGEGGMGSVFKVEHVRMQKLAALKLMRPEFAVDKSLTARFLQEARVIGKLSHPNTVQVFDTGELDDGSLYITMEYVPGKDLAWQLKAHGPLSEQKAINVALQLLASLQEAHDAGIVHRDLKPANVMLVRRRKGEDQVKLLDFGIAKLAEGEGSKSTTSDFVGTPAYMSPEQVRGDEVDARSDLYALGAMLFELVTGRQLYVGATPLFICTQHLEAPVPSFDELQPRPSVTPAFEGIMRKALEKQREARWLNAEEMRAALETLGREQGALPTNVTPTPMPLSEKMLSREDFDRYERRLRAWRVVTPLLFVVALAVALGLLFGGYEKLRAPPAISTEELEPNDDPAHATRVPLGAELHGAIGASTASDNDRDLYVLDVPAGRYRASLSGLDDLNLTLEVLQVERDEVTGKPADHLRRRVFLDDEGLGHGEAVEGLALTEGPVYLRVEEKAFATEAPRPSRERALQPYTLSLQPMPAESGPAEQEPNDTPLTAWPLSLEAPTPAFTGAHPDDVERLTALRPDAPPSTVDWFRLEGVPEGEAVQVLVIPPPTGALAVHDGAVLDAWRVKRAQPQHAGLPMPAPQVVKGAPAVLELKAGPAGLRRVRVVPLDDAAAHQPYVVAPVSVAQCAAAVAAVRALPAESQAKVLDLLEARVGHLPEFAALRPQTLPAVK